eukprot:2155659-Pleurochrysis_carterae.AAC.2
MRAWLTRAVTPSPLAVWRNRAISHPPMPRLRDPAHASLESHLRPPRPELQLSPCAFCRFARSSFSATPSRYTTASWARPAPHTAPHSAETTAHPRTSAKSLNTRHQVAARSISETACWPASLSYARRLCCAPSLPSPPAHVYSAPAAL